MANEPENLVLTMLRCIDAKTGRIADDVPGLKVRQPPDEEAQAGVNRRLDRLDLRVERLDPVEA
jgi:hypothetical protein